MKVTVIIPTYKPGVSFRRLMKKLSTQTYPIEKIIIMNTEQQYWKDALIQDVRQAEVHHITKAEFDHGKTRAMGAAMAKSDILVYFTQDAVPADDLVVQHLVQVFQDESVGAAYGRQLPNPDCKFIEAYTRGFNYPKNSSVKRKSDLPKLGIKTYFCSNVCSAYRKSVYEKMGGFITRTIFNEDMIFAGHAVEAGYQIAYAADAQVIHSHNYTAMQQLHRNFDLGVSQADHPEVFGRLHSEGEGIRLVKKTAKWLVENGHALLMPQLVMASGSKYAGYWLGKHYKKLPEGLIRSLTMNPAYWEGEAGDGR